MLPKIWIEHFTMEIDPTTYRFKIQSDMDNPRAFLKEGRKIYVVRNGKKNLHVGEANTSIQVRLQRGFVSFRYYNKNKKARGGYKGYKWIIQEFKRHSTITVATFDSTVDHRREFVEAVEGELVFLTRSETGRWPIHQNEIHFSNEKGAATMARKIFKQIK